MKEKEIDVEKFCKDINRCMAWMKTGVAVAWVPAWASLVISIYLLATK